MAESGVIAVMRGVPADRAVETARALARGGVGAVELTADAPGAVDALGAVRTDLTDDEVLVGAGTVMDAATASRAVDAGADFVVAPHLDTATVETCNRYGVVCLPGVLTPTEAVRAVEAGADGVKVFPAATVGPDHLAALKGPLPQIPLVPTGGVDTENAGDYLAAGATAVGAGSALVDADAAASGDFDAVETRAREFVAAVAEARAD
ncbi:MAG: bifunctional 4-hydroxy-2-oxoglutarate aldolase/2-dehydro-3-deoxy-phosphogluconate aldolase [Haloferacaceae archaeon]